MTYEKALEYINKSSENKIIPGLDNIKALCSLLGNPEKKVKTIHIAGTNGKGSVGAFISSALIESGYSVCRYTSPQVLNYRDRLTYNNNWISKEELTKAVEDVKALIENSNIKPTVFELETAIAFYWISNKNCDFAIIETGMGGKGDATNVTDKILSVITPIAIDHTKFLGNTISEIAEEKAGIIKGRAVSAIQQNEAYDILKKHCKDIIFSEKPKNIRYSLEKTTFNYKYYKNIEITMLGKYQTENAALAIEALEALNTMGYSINNISQGLKNAKWSCRFQVISHKPLVIVDGAHNIHGAYALEENVKLYLKNKKIAFITGVLRDKNYEKIAEIMAPYAEKIFTIESKSLRALSCIDYGNAIKRYNKNTEAVNDIKLAIKKALDFDAVLVFGSLSFMEEIYEAFKENLCITE